MNWQTDLIYTDLRKIKPDLNLDCDKDIALSVEIRIRRLYFQPPQKNFTQKKKKQQQCKQLFNTLTVSLADV